jgi:hypothetical protein
LNVKHFGAYDVVRLRIERFAIREKTLELSERIGPGK